MSIRHSHRLAAALTGLLLALPVRAADPAPADDPHAACKAAAAKATADAARPASAQSPSCLNSVHSPPLPGGVGTETIIGKPRAGKLCHAATVHVPSSSAKTSACSSLGQESAAPRSPANRDFPMTSCTASIALYEGLAHGSRPGQENRPK